jgi:hypothetical protein
LGPAADILSQKNHTWLLQSGLGFKQQRQVHQHPRGLLHVAAGFMADAGGGLGKAAATAAYLMDRVASSMGRTLCVPGFGFRNRPLPQGFAPDFRVMLNRDGVLTLQQVLGSYDKQQQHVQEPQQQRLRDLQQLLDWWPWLIAAQEELMQAVWQLAVQRLLMCTSEVG